MSAVRIASVVVFMSECEKYGWFDGSDLLQPLIEIIGSYFVVRGKPQLTA